MLSDGLGDISTIDIFSDSGSEDSEALRLFAEAALHRRAAILEGSQELRFLRQSLPTLTALASFIVQQTPRNERAADCWDDVLERLGLSKGSAESLAYYKSCPFSEGMFTSDYEAIACISALCMSARLVTVKGRAESPPEASSSPSRSKRDITLGWSPLTPSLKSGGESASVATLHSPTSSLSPSAATPLRPAALPSVAAIDVGPLDLRLFKGLDVLTIVDCCVNAVHGDCSCVRLVLLRSTIQQTTGLKSWLSFSVLRELTATNATQLGSLLPDGVAAVAGTLTTLRADKSILGETFPLLRSLENDASTAKHSDSTPWSRLTELDLRHNEFSSVHQTIRSAPNITKLVLSYNQLVTLHPNLRYCEALTHVDLQHNNLRNPTEISAFLPHVTYLDVSHNKLVSVWELATLKNLSTLDIGFNKLGHWSDLAHLAESCLSLQSITFRGNPMCEPTRIFGGDVNKLGYAVFRSQPDILVNGAARALDDKQSQQLLSKYAHLFQGSSLDALEADRAKHFDPKASIPSPDSLRELASVIPTSDESSHTPSLYGSSFRHTETVVTSGKKTVRIVKKVVKKKKVDVDGDHCDDALAQAINPDDHIDPVTGDKPDLAFLIAKYGPAPGLTRYNEMTEHLIRRQRYEKAEDSRRQQGVEETVKEDEHTEIAIEAAVPPGPVAPPKNVISSLQGETFANTVDQGLQRFLLEELQKKLGLSYKCFPVKEETIPGCDKKLLYDEEAGALANNSADWTKIQQNLVSSHFDNIDDALADSNPLLRYTGKNIWQVDLGRGRSLTDSERVVEVWLDDVAVADEIENVPSRYDGRYLIKVEKFDYDCSIGFAVRQKHVEVVSKIVNFPQPVLTSVHFCPWSHGRADFMMDVTNAEIITTDHRTNPVQAAINYAKKESKLTKRTNSTESIDTLDGGEAKIKITMAQKREMIGTYSRPTTPQMLVGIVVPNAEVGANVMKILFQKFRDFRNPHYVLQRLDWPLMTQYTGHVHAMRAPFHGNGLEQAEEVEVLRGIAREASDDAISDPLPECTFREELGQSIEAAMRADAVEVVVHQRLGSMFRVHPEEISFHIKTLLIPPGIQNESQIKIIGSSFANACMSLVDTHRQVSEREREFSVFIVVLNTTFCMFEDFNYEGSPAVHSDDLFKPIVTYDISDLAFVAIGFGVNHLTLNFGKGTDEIILFFRDVTSTLRMIGFLRQAVSSRCSFIMLPWYRRVIEAMDRDPDTPDVVADYFQCFFAQLSLVVQTDSKVHSAKYAKVSMSTIDFTASSRDLGSSRNVSLPPQNGKANGSTATKKRFGFNFKKDSPTSAAAPAVEYLWEARTYPLRHIPPLTQTCWERVSIVFVKPSYRVHVISEHPDKWAGDPVHYADEVLSFPVLGISFIEVCPRLSKVPLVAVIHADLSGGAGGATVDKFLVVFQHDSSLEAFVTSIQKFHAEATAALGNIKSSSAKVSAASVLFNNTDRARETSTLLVTQIAAKSSQHNSAITMEQVLQAILE